MTDMGKKISKIVKDKYNYIMYYSGDIYLMKNQFGPIVWYSRHAKVSGKLFVYHDNTCPCQ